MSDGVQYEFPWSSDQTRYLVLGITRNSDYLYAALEVMADGDAIGAAALETRVRTAAAMTTNGTVVGPLVQHALGAVDWGQVAEALRLVESRCFRWGTDHE